MKQYNNRAVKNSGQLLLEVLIAIGLVAMIALIVLTALQTGPKTTQTANVQSRATELAREAQDIVRDIAGRDWNKICDSAYTGCELTPGSPYHAEIDPTTTEWMLVSGSEIKTLANADYTRSVVIDNVCRDEAGNIVEGGGGGTGPPMVGGATLNNFTGFETGGFEEATNDPDITAVHIQSSIVRTGSYSMKIDPIASIYDISAFEDGMDSGNDFVFGFAFRASDVTPGARIGFVIAERSIIDTDMTLVLETNGDLLLWNETPGVEVGRASTPFVNNTWHFIEVWWQNKDPGDAKVFVDGIEVISVINQDFLSSSAFSAANGGYYRFQGGTWGTADVYFDDFYAYSGASGTNDFLGNAEVFAYQSGHTTNQDLGDALEGVGDTWSKVGQTPGSDADTVRYTSSTKSGGTTTNDPNPGGARSGPAGDPNIDGDANIKGAKWIHRLSRVTGGGTIHYKRYGNSGDGMRDTAISVSTDLTNFSTLSEDPAVVPLSTEYFQYGIRVDGAQDLIASEIWAMILHRPSSGPVVSCQDDPSTRKVTVTVSAKGLNPLKLITYLTRWGKKDTGQSYAQNCAAFQTDWSGGVSTTASTAGTVPCASASDLGNLFGNAWYKLTATSSPVTSTEGMEFQKIPGSLFVEPQP